MAANETLLEVEGMREPMSRDLALQAVAKALAAAGDAPNAQAAASAISSPLSSSARAWVAKTLAEAGDIAAARSTAETIDQPRSLAVAQCAIANAAASAGDVTMARQSASAARATASAIPNPEERAQMVDWVAAELKTEGGPTAARATVGDNEIRRNLAAAAAMDNPVIKADMYVAVAKELLAAGDVSAAKEAASAARAAAASEPSWPFISAAKRAGATINAAEVLALAGDGSAARSAAASLEDPWFRCLAHVAVAKGLVTAGYLAEGRGAAEVALQDATELDDPGSRAQALADVAVAARRAAATSPKALPIGGPSPRRVAVPHDEARAQRRTSQEKVQRGCYVATAVYGSYDCPEVWVLRRWRDRRLASTAVGRQIIRTYYGVSPKVVGAVGSQNWFSAVLRAPLDRFVLHLQSTGYSSLPYTDR